MKFNEKLKLIREVNNLTQSDLANAIGVSRGNIANLELGNVQPTQVFLNCLSMTYGIDKNWLIDDSNSSLEGLTDSKNILNQIIENYERLDDEYKLFVGKQIEQLLEIQEAKK